tara:strand:+ start:461 stop:718 length:258 start_codon:yes stop_codon:yes gene_type:complete
MEREIKVKKGSVNILRSLILPVKFTFGVIMASTLSLIVYCCTIIPLIFFTSLAPVDFLITFVLPVVAIGTCYYTTFKWLFKSDES